jgi:hypothetical protein
MSMALLKVLLAAVALVSIAMAADADASPRRIALLLGNADYNGNRQFDDDAQPPYLTDLQYPCADTSLVRRQLSRLQFEIAEHCDSNRDSFRRHADAFADLIGDLPPESIVFVYYSGHGSQQFGSIYWIPTMFTIPPGLQRAPDAVRSAYFHDNAVDIDYLVTLLPQRRDIAVVIALDNCRDAIAPASPTYNEKVTPDMPANFLTQYATTSGETTIDNGTYATFLAEELASGDSIDKVIGRVTSRLYDLADNDKNKYPYIVPGPEFQRMPFLRRLDTQLPVQPPQTLLAVQPPRTDPGRSKGISQTGRPPPGGRMQELQPDSHRTRLDIFWCTGDGEEERYATAMSVGQRIAGNSEEFEIGRIRVRKFDETINSKKGYRVHRNLVRYDKDDIRERNLLGRVVAAFPDVGFLPTPGVGEGGKPTSGYVSAFVCADSSGPTLVDSDPPVGSKKGAAAIK